MRSLVWFRSDLRTDDHPALARACELSDDGVVAVFAVCPDQWREHDWAPIKVDFILRTLSVLSTSLASLNIALRIVTVRSFDGVPAALLELARSQDCDALHFNRELEVNETCRDDAVTEAFEAAGMTVGSHDDQTIMPATRIRTGSGTPYSVFTPFKKAWWVAVEEDGYVLAETPPKRAAMVGRPDAIPSSVDGFEIDSRREDLWPAGERVALDRLRMFIEAGIERYKDRRDTPGVAGTSCLSPYFTIGALSARRCVSEVLERVPDAREENGPSTWLSEVIWREFYRHVLIAHPRVCMHRPFKVETDRIKWRDDEAGFAAWAEGRTGIPIVDAGMRQLLDEGWMHNRVRMITAMFLTKNLLIDWRRGERHFMRHLIDGDLASNNGGWQWSASTGTDAAPYFRVMNPVSQSVRFDPEGAYIRRFVPELSPVEGKAIHDPPELLRASLGYPPAICDLKATRQRAIDAFRA